jgi:putative membrane protein
MKNLSDFCLGLTLVFLFSGCNNGSSDSVKNAKDSNAAAIDSQRAQESSSLQHAPGLSGADADFLVNAASGSMMEVELGQLAQTNSRTQRVKAFGAMMVRDHGKGGGKLKALASARNVTLPDAVSNQQQKEIDDLKKKKGNEFDKAYIRLMVSDHKDDIREFEKQAGKGTDSLIRTFASSGLEMLRRHLDSANSLVGAIGLNYVKGVPPEPIP